MTTKAPIALALDAPDLATMTHWVRCTSPFVSTMKIGMETFYRDGESAIDVVAASGCDCFLDLKLHDIPNTVAGAARSLARFRPNYLTVHALGGSAMIQAAADALPETRITAVTILTSHDDRELVNLGIHTPAQEAVVRLARIAVAAGARSIVCSPHEVAAVREALPPDIVLITPGVRPRSADVHDQKRVSSPEEALLAGANLLVIGRPITGAPDITKAAQELSHDVREYQGMLNRDSRHDG
jgi:orotidine-5'-phosphate decarboxylase